MTKFFYDRLRTYYLQVAEVLRGEARAASVFPNTTDIGISRERAYAEFLKQHAPSKCNVFLGGFLFGADGQESAQLDVIVTTDTTPRFNFPNAGDASKSFSPVDGTLAVASIKSTLNKTELEDALRGFASIPRCLPLTGRVPHGISISEHDDWPYKILYATAGIDGSTLASHLDAFYQRNPEIPDCRRPNVIHVSGAYTLTRVVPGMSGWDNVSNSRVELAVGRFLLSARDPDLSALLLVLDALQQRAGASAHILYSYGELRQRVLGIPD